MYSETASGVLHWKAPRIMRQLDNKGMNLDGRTTIILFEKVSTQKEVVKDFIVIFPKSRRYFKLAPVNMVRGTFK